MRERAQGDGYQQLPKALCCTPVYFKKLCLCHRGFWPKYCHFYLIIHDKMMHTQAEGDIQLHYSALFGYNSVFIVYPSELCHELRNSHVIRMEPRVVGMFFRTT